jgi:DNA-binding beta-propeller fold protein YncE
MSGTSKTLIRQVISAMGAAALLCLTAASAAHSADRIYWVNSPEGGGTTISHAELAGGGGGEIAIAATPGVFGLGIDSAAGKIYTLGGNGTDVLSANLDGTGPAPLDTTGAPVGETDWLAVDPGAGRAYWTDEKTDAISFANLRGGGGGALDTTGVAVRETEAIAVHPAGGKVYWINDEAIAFASLGGGGGGTLNIVNGPGPFGRGLAIDESSNTIYWVDGFAETIEFASLNGGMSRVLDTGAAPFDDPVGLAIDPDAGRIYWANENDSIGFAKLKGGGGGQLAITGANVDAPVTPALLKTPVAAKPAQVAGRTRAGSTLSCESAWAPDLSESFLYRAPQTVTYLWLRDGRPIAGATVQTVTARQAGSYACQATGANAAGSASSTSAPLAVNAALKLGKVRFNRNTGTATLTVAAFGTGQLKLSGVGVKARSTKARAKARLGIRPNGRVKKRLEATGRARVKATVSFRPDGGKPLKRSKKIVLKLNRR